MANPINKGSQVVRITYEQNLTSKNENQAFYQILPSGVYSGGALSFLGNDVTINPLTCFIWDDDIANKTGIRIETTTIYTMVGEVTELAPYIILTYEWVDSENNYLDFVAKAVGDIDPKDIVLAEATFTGGNIDGFDYSLRSSNKIYGMEESPDITNNTIPYLDVSESKIKFTDSPIQYDGSSVIIDGDIDLYDGVTDQDRSIKFASDAEILWDESADYFWFPTKDIKCGGIILGEVTGDRKIQFAGDANMFWDESQDRFEFDKAIQSSSIITCTGLVLGAGSEDRNIQFAGDANLLWNESNNQFEFDKKINVNSSLQCLELTLGTGSGNRLIQFAGDASIFWDESLNRFVLNKRIEINSELIIGTGSVDSNIQFATDANIFWDESDDQFEFDKDVAIDGIAKGLGTHDPLKFKGIYRNAAGTETSDNYAIKEIEIGDWDMDTNSLVLVTHNLGTGWTSARVLSIIIKNDDDTSYTDLNSMSGNFIDINGGLGAISGSSILLRRRTGGAFDNNTYDSTSYNRGFILIAYKP